MAAVSHSSSERFHGTHHDNMHGYGQSNFMQLLALQLLLSSRLLAFSCKPCRCSHIDDLSFQYMDSIHSVILSEAEIFIISGQQNLYAPLSCRSRETRGFAEPANTNAFSHRDRANLYIHTNAIGYCSRTIASSPNKIRSGPFHFRSSSLRGTAIPISLTPIP